jgi:hypothetical protein
MSFVQSIQAGFSSAWAQITSAVSTYAPVVQTHAVALFTLFNTNVTTAAIAKSTTLVAPLGAAGPCVWLLPTFLAGIASMKLQDIGDKADSTMATVAARIAGLAFAVAAGAAAAVFVGSFLGVATTLGIVVTYGTFAAVTLFSSLLRPPPCQVETVF